MNWSDIKARGHIVVDGQSYSLGHLQDQTYRVVIDATGKHPRLEFDMVVKYSSHCVSWGPERGQTIDFEEHGEDRRIIDEKGVHRCFSDERHGLTQYLPNVFRDLINRNCFFIGRESWLVIDIVDDQGVRKEYEVFFNITKSHDGRLKVFVESAYVRDDRYLQQKPKPLDKQDKIKGKTLLSKKSRGEPIRRQSIGRLRG